MDRLFRLTGARVRDPAVEAWFVAGEPLRSVVEPWFAALKGCGDEVGELIHDGRPTLCVKDAALAYVDAFSAHAAIGFFQGAALDDPSGLLQGSGAHMRHVKLLWGQPTDDRALKALMAAAYEDLRQRLESQP